MQWQQWPPPPAIPCCSSRDAAGSAAKTRAGERAAANASTQQGLCEMYPCNATKAARSAMLPAGAANASPHCIPPLMSSTDRAPISYTGSGVKWFDGWEHHTMKPTPGQLSGREREREREFRLSRSPLHHTSQVYAFIPAPAPRVVSSLSPLPRLFFF